MRSTLSLRAGFAAIILLACSTTVSTHTWAEQVRNVASNGSFVGAPGYIRNYGPRKDGVNIDAVNSHLVPPNGRDNNAFLPADLMCKSNQLKGQQTEGYPALSASPLEQVAIQYHDNGHVTLYDTNQGKPAGRGTIFVYGTAASLDSDTYLGIHRVWNPQGTGGDKRGKLLATRPYDDGRCFQVNRGSKLRQASINYPADKSEDILCQTDVQLPADAPTSGSYTLYWVWEWPTLDASGKVATNESYTSCMDISMTSQPPAAAGKFAAQNPVGLGANDVAIEAQFNNHFLVDPTAAPVLTSDNLPKGGATKLTQGVAPVTMSPPVTMYVAPAPASSAITTSPAVQSTGQPASTGQLAYESKSFPALGSLVTVTMTTQEIDTVSVTSVPSSSPASASDAGSLLTTTAAFSPPNASSLPAKMITSMVTVTLTAPPIPSSASAVNNSMVSVLPSSATAPRPSPSPFLTSDSVVAAPSYATSAGPTPSSCAAPQKRRRSPRNRGR